MNGSFYYRDRGNFQLFWYIVLKLYSLCLWHTGLYWTFKANISWQSLLPKIPKWSLAGTQHWVLDRNEYFYKWLLILCLWWLMNPISEASVLRCAFLGREISTWLTRHRYNRRVLEDDEQERKHCLREKHVGIWLMVTQTHGFWNKILLIILLWIWHTLCLTHRYVLAELVRDREAVCGGSGLVGGW